MTESRFPNGSAKKVRLRARLCITHDEAAPKEIVLQMRRSFASGLFVQESAPLIFEKFETYASVYCVLTIRQKKNQKLVTGTVAFAKVLLETIASITTRACTPESGQGGRQVPLL